MDPCADRQDALGAVFSILLMSCSTERGSAELALMRSRHSPALPSAHCIITLRAKTSCWSRCSIFSTSWPWRVFGNTKAVIRATRIISSRSYFPELAKWSTKPGWTGAGFTRLVMELADLPDHPARAVAHRHKAAVERWYTELFAKARVSSPSKRAREVALLVEGATALILIHGDRSYAETAAQAAEQLVQKS